MPRAWRAVWLTYLGMWARALARAFWPCAAAIAAVLGCLALGGLDQMTLDGLWFVGLAMLLAIVLTAIWGMITLVRPTWDAALDLVDRGLTNRPIRALMDIDFVKQPNADDPQIAHLWRRHRDHMRAEADRARPIWPKIDLTSQDPFGLRYLALLILLVGVIFGTPARIIDVTDPRAGDQTALGGLGWEAWVTPPDYTNKATLYLNDLTDHATLAVVPNSLVQIRLYGQLGDYLVEETISKRTEDVPAASALVQEFHAHAPGQLAIVGDAGARWDVTLVPDLPPNIDVLAGFEADFFGQSQLSYTASDDYGVTALAAQIDLNLSQVSRRHGLAADPDFDQTVNYDLPLPVTGRTQDFQDTWTEDHSQSILAHLPVTVTLSAQDALDQTATAQLRDIELPARTFFDPLAAAIIEARRDLLWSAQNARRVSRMIRAITYDPQGAFRKETDYMRLRYILRRLDTYIGLGTVAQKRSELAQALWDLALSIEEGDVNDALERMREAQERLSQAMKNGASQPEIERLMQELRQANENYLRQLRQQAERDQSRQNQDMAQNSPQDQMQMNQSDLEEMMNRIQELMEQGRMAEAQQALDELQRMMENMQVAEGEQGQNGPGQEGMDQLSETLREQQQLSDDAFRNLQNPNPQGSEGQGTPQDLADRQQSLRDQLQGGRDNLPSLDGDSAARGQSELDRADRAMRQAEEALRQRDLDRAIENQAQAMDALREGIREMDRAIAEARRPDDGQGTAANQDGQQGRDPLGRPQGRDGNSGTAEADATDQDIARQAQEVLDEIRRRASELERPEAELNYLKRLLDLF